MRSKHPLFSDMFRARSLSFSLCTGVVKFFCKGFSGVFSSFVYPPPPPPRAPWLPTPSPLATTPLSSSYPPPIKTAKSGKAALKNCTSAQKTVNPHHNRDSNSNTWQRHTSFFPPSIPPLAFKYLYDALVECT